MAEPGRSIVVFDLGGVLIDWDPRHLYRKLFADAAAMEHFLATVCTHEWHRQHDSGLGMAESVAALKLDHPDHAEMIEAFAARQDEMMAGPIDGAVTILAELKERGRKLYALSNWPAETFPSARRRFDFLDWFDGIVVSGEVGAIKPEPRIYEALIERFAIPPHSAVFIDDVEANAAAARAFGIHAIRFTTPEALRAELVTLGLL
jgi:2-haloacid dehalogenase